ncbi:VirB3 family type IV secretion system protein [Dongshaea marina]|uniref:VirB3 family type IV secretion system protein n=1 Tax=Dongshaea marina TaxID=2047966 RepID=UPI000D3E6CA0|nr:VirB3 family type IV secretion system protein [Dongshaea marina]
MDPVFKACTRPALLFGVPMKPFLVISALILIITFYSNFLFETGLWTMLLLPVVYGWLWVLCKFDDCMLDLLLLKCRMRVRNRNINFYGGRAVYAPIRFERWPKKETNRKGA